MRVMWMGVRVKNTVLRGKSAERQEVKRLRGVRGKSEGGQSHERSREHARGAC